jgi:hypothetical protein
LIISTILGYVKEDEINKYSEKIVELQKMIFVLINKLSGGQRRE